MSKAKMKLAGVTKSLNEAQEAEWWDARRPAVEADIRRRLKHKKAVRLADVMQGAKLTQPITLRISSEDLEIARRQAARKGLGYQTYIKMVLKEALANNPIK